MKILQSFEEFLFERETSIQLLIDSSRFLDGIIDSAKREKLIKSVVQVNHWSTSDKSRPSISGLAIGNQYSHRSGISFIVNKKTFTAGLLTEDYNYKVENDLNPARVLVISESPFSLSDIDEVISKNVEATNKNTIYKFERRIVKDSSSTKNTLDKYDVGTYDTYYIYFEYTMTKEEGEGVTFDMAKNSQAFKDFLNKYPVKVVSTPTQIKKGTLVFAIPAELVVDPGHEFTKPGEKYAANGYALFKTGYIRRMPMNDHLRTQPGVVGKFNSTTLKGWEESFNELSRFFEKMKKEMEKRGVKLITTPEERHTYRGLISGHKFGI